MSSIRRLRRPTRAKTPRTAALATEKPALLARLRLGSCGLRGSPETPRSATSREKEMSPPRDPLGAAPDKLALAPRDLSCATRLCAPRPRSSHGPHWSAAVGH